MSWQNKAFVKPLMRLMRWRIERMVDKGMPDHQAWRKAMNDFAGLVMLHSDYKEQEGSIDNVPVLWVKPKKGRENERVLLYIHGGAFIAGTPHTFKGMVSMMCDATGDLDGVLVDYRLAPEHPHPAGLEDCVRVYQGLLADGYQPQNIVIGGDSAGGNLTIATLLKLKQENIPLPCAAIDMSGVHDLTLNGESVESRADRDPILRPSVGGVIVKDYCEEQDVKNPFISPIFGDLESLPPIYLMVGTEEVLYSDCTEFAERAKKAGIDLTLDIGEDMIHDWPLNYLIIPEGKATIQELGKFMNAHLGRVEQQETVAKAA